MLLSVHELSVRFKTHRGVVPAVDRVCFSLQPGKTLCIVGESGCGKSVTALAVLRLLPKKNTEVSGSVVFDGREILSTDERSIRAIRGNQIGMIFQEPMTSLNPVITVGDQVAESLREHRPGIGRRECRDRVVDLFESVGISSETIADYPHELSGGMRQRVMIAMALACSPRLIIADEPTTALDVTIQAQILELLRRLQSQLHMSVILITHDLGIVSEMADEVLVMYAGRVVERASRNRLFEKPLHPYTIGLMACLPESHAPGTRMTGIPGAVPSPYRLPRGCYFQDRCARVTPHCRETDPPLEDKQDNHQVRCVEVSSCS